MRPQHLGVVCGYRCESLESRLLLTTNTAAVELLHTSPAVFVKNVGQWADPSVKFVHQGDGANIAMTNRGPVFELYRDVAPVTDSRDRLNDPRVELNRTESKIERTRFSVDFLNAKVVSPVGQDVSSSTFNYFLGDASTHRSNVQGFEKVVYPSLWSGIDLHTWGQRDSLKYEFNVAPGFDYHQIALRYDGIDQLWIDRKGRLNAQLTNGFGTVRDDKPVIYQEVNGRRIDVAGRFKLLDEQSYTFELTGKYNSKFPLIIDPDLAWSSYVGGSGHDFANGIAIDAAGNAWAVGSTYSADLPADGFDPSFNGGEYQYDAFVARINANGTLAWLSYLGGSDIDECNDVALDALGNAWITGSTDSTNFPGGGFDRSHNGGVEDAFMAKVNADGSFAWGSYLGGSGSDYGIDIAMDSSGSAWVTGQTDSTNFPAGGFDASYNGGACDAFVAKVNANGTFAWGSYLGGSDQEGGSGIAIDNSGNAWITGGTASQNWAARGFDTSYNGGESDGFVAKVNANATLAWSSYFGGPETESGTEIALDAAGNAWVTGSTNSAGWATNGFDTLYGGEWDAFIVKVNGNGTLDWSSYLGGAGGESGSGIAIDKSGNAWVTGGTGASDWVSGGFDTSFNGYGDALVVKINTDGTVAWSSYLGGSSGDSGMAIAVDDSGNVWVAGETLSFDWTAGGFDNSYGGWFDGFVARINDGPSLGIAGETYGVRGQPLSVRPSVNNADPADLAVGYRYDVDYGDGSRQTVQRRPNNAYGTGFIHAYKNTGKYTISVSATDSHGRTSAVYRYRVSIVAIATMPDPAVPGQKSLFVGGTRGNDAISFEKAASGQVRLIFNGMSQGLFKPAVRIIAFGQDGNDVIQLAPDLATNVIFFGGAGNDVLSGGSGRNALFGNAGNDSLYGLGGRDILVGSSGKDLLQGDDSGDILIGGRTDVETGSYMQICRIDTLLETWNSDASYAERIKQITHRDFGNNASFSTFTVHDDAAIDILTGGTGLDWFFANIQGSSKDKIHSELGEVITAIV